MLYGDLPELVVDGQTVRGVTVKIPNPPKSAVLRLPTSQEMLDRMNLQKSIRKSLGRGKSKNEFVVNPKADLALFNRIRLDKGEEFDEYEAAVAVGKLTGCEVLSCEDSGDQYLIVLKTAFGETTHVLGKPSEKDLWLYRRSVMSSVDLPHGQEELHFRTDPAIALYDSVVRSIDGYSVGTASKDVPPNHKSTVVIELAQAVAEVDLDLDPNS